MIKLHVATWHAGPHFVHDECLFVNLENLDTNRRDFHAVPLDVECRYRLSAAQRRFSRHRGFAGIVILTSPGQTERRTAMRDYTYATEFRHWSVASPRNTRAP